MLRNKYRIISDTFNGYECQKKRWWFPIWIQMGTVNSHLTLDEAKKYIANDGASVETLWNDET